MTQSQKMTSVQEVRIYSALKERYADACLYFLESVPSEFNNTLAHCMEDCLEMLNNSDCNATFARCLQNYVRRARRYMNEKIAGNEICSEEHRLSELAYWTTITGKGMEELIVLRHMRRNVQK